MSDGMQTQQMPQVSGPAPGGGAPVQTGVAAPGGAPGGRGGIPVWALIVVTLAVALLVGAGVYLWQSAQAAALEAELQASLSEIASMKASIAELEKRVASAETSAAIAVAAAAGGTESGTSGSGGSGSTGSSNPVVIKQFTFVNKGTESGGKYKLVLDYAQMLTGSAAAAAATAHGDESPPPNDYYIVNDNSKLRTFPVKSGIKVKVYGVGGGDSSAASSIPYGQWFDMMPGGVNPQDEWAEAPYWVWITDGVVTKIEQQFLP